MKNPFEILECSSKDTPERINKIFKKLAMKYHPDRNTHLSKDKKKEYEERFKDINCAYTYLKKNNFKYDGNFNSDDFNSYSNFFTNRFFKNGNGIDVGNLFTKFKNLNLDNVANNILKGINSIQDIYDNNDEKLEKAENLCINANVELIDIYNNVKKELTIDLVKKCKTCMALGYNIDTKLTCSKCKGNKLLETKENLSFYCAFKNNCFKNAGNEELGKRPGNIYVNIIPKFHKEFKIINDYHVSYRIMLNKNNNNESIVIKTNEFFTIKHKIKYLDLEEYELVISNPKYNSSNLYEFKIDNYGLLMPNGNRGSLIIEIIDFNNTLSLLDSKKKNTLVNFVKL